LVARLLSGRALWIGLAIVASSVVAFLRNRTRAAKLSLLMDKRRGAPESDEFDGPRVVHDVLRESLGAVTHLPAIELHPNDRLRVEYDLGLRETRALIDLLEERLDCSLPDSRVVQAMTVGELLHVLTRRTSVSK
jgi:predicted nucleic acid-binding protein